MSYGNTYVQKPRLRNELTVITIWRWLQFADEIYRSTKNKLFN